MDKFTKMSELVNDQFTVEEVGEHKYKMWDNANRKMLISDTPTKGYRKVYPVKTDKGLLDLGQGQMGTLLEETSYKGEANIIGRTFHVKSNGKEGMEIRYFFNATDPKPQIDEGYEEPPIDLNEIPF